MDDATLYTTVGHHGMAICNPLSSAQLDTLVAHVAPTLSGACHVVDVGCGKGELLIRLAARTGCRALGLEPNPVFAGEMRASAAARAPGRVDVIQGTAEEVPLAEEAYETSAVVGANHAFGGTLPTIRALRRATRPGGHVILGDGYWRRRPGDAELAALGMPSGELPTLAALTDLLVREGLSPVEVAVAGVAEWDAYEGRHQHNLEAYARDHPDDAQARRLWARRVAWQAAYLAAGRDVLGFALILARRP